MIIKKFFHSCLLIEENGKKLLFDPGLFSFVEGKLKPEDIGPVDIIVLTHKHVDHFYPEAVQKICSMQETTILTHHEIGELLALEGLSYESIEAGEKRDISGFRVEAFLAPHGELPIEVPHNLAYRVNEFFLHPGDSLQVSPMPSCKLLALPIAAPWMKLLDAMKFVDQITPEQVIPIHDAMIKDFMLDRLYDMMLLPAFQKRSIIFHLLRLGETMNL